MFLIFDRVQNPSFFNHFKIRSENTKHTFGNNKYLTPDLGGQFIPAYIDECHWYSNNNRAALTTANPEIILTDNCKIPPKPEKNLAGFLFGLEVTDCDPKWGGSKYFSMAFTEQGVDMLSSVLKKDLYTISFL